MRLLNHQRAFELKHGRDVQVRLATRFVFEARDNKGMSFREVAVLSAIYSKIGAATGPVRITRDEIRRRAHGFKSKQVFNQEIGLGLPEISERRIRTLIESLHDRGFFARITYARRQTYYSHRLTAEKLADAIFQQKIRRTKAQNARIRVNKQLTDRVKAERQQLSASMPEQASRVPLR
ncbi:MAG: hypothetical protein ABJB09_03885 [Verrucomicrobiota bacterium]